jgi:uncharacterized protein
MARIEVLDESVSFEHPKLIEGLPGIGLVGKIAADHMVDTFEMTHYANVLCESLPKVATYNEQDPTLSPPVRLYAAPDYDLLVLQSDIPIAPGAVADFAGCFSGWQRDSDVTPIYLSGLPVEKEAEVPSMYGVAAGDGATLLDEGGIGNPAENGLISGPTGALLHESVAKGLTAVGLIVESDPQFPDPEAARVLIKDGIEPLTNVTIDTTDLVEHTEDIRKAKEQLAKRMHESDSEATQAMPLRGYQ